MGKELQIQVPGVFAMNKKSLQDLNGGFFHGIIVKIMFQVMKSGSGGGRGITEDQYAECFEGCSGVQYEGWEGGF